MLCLGQAPCSDDLLLRRINVTQKKSGNSLLSLRSRCQLVVMQLDRQCRNLLPRCPGLSRIVVSLKHSLDREDAKPGLFVLCFWLLKVLR